MTKKHEETPAGKVCAFPDPDLSGITVVELEPNQSPADYLAAMDLAKEEATRHMDDYMLISWYDRDRDFESPQHTTESDAPSAIPGYVNYGISHDAKLKVDIEGGRFVFFFTPIDF
ncbi:MAG TPA: hypothetical protein ENK96_02295 [Desulfobulbaceae bacterium]|nr:hypothetical protein [Desulfobulbaceae bacterium]